MFFRVSHQSFSRIVLGLSLFGKQLFFTHSKDYMGFLNDNLIELGAKTHFIINLGQKCQSKVP